uniref:Hybrid sensor histidine kinase/response regulator n=1 Tax=Desulfatirhabdium butyrativorans TaxID=340467 RepID=A0A7C4RUQ2_9BACT
MKGKALVVDNDFFFVEFLSDLLEKRGYKVIKAYDGKEGITKLREETVNILFVDIIMPKIDGKQLIQFTRNLFPEKPFPIIALSGSLIETIEDVQKIGADYYIAKGPIETMAEHIDRFLDKLEAHSAIDAPPEIMETARMFPRQSTAELVEMMDFQEGILESIGVGILVVDKDAKIIRINATGLKILQKPLEVLLNRHIGTVFPESAYSHLVGAMKAVARNPDRIAATFPIDDSGIHWRIIVSIHRVAQKPIGWIVALEELTSWDEPASKTS